MSQDDIAALLQGQLQCVYLYRADGDIQKWHIDGPAKVWSDGRWLVPISDGLYDYWYIANYVGVYKGSHVINNWRQFSAEP